MNTVQSLVNNDELFIPADHAQVQRSGRMDIGAESEAVMVFPCSYLKWRFEGNSAAVIFDAKQYYFDMYMGCIIDGKQSAFRIDSRDGVQRLELAQKLPEGEHEIIFFKRQDACNRITVYGIVLNRGARLTEPSPKPDRRIELYGDSVSAGEVSEAVDYVGKPDPEGHNGRYSNAWYSYSWMTARKLNAELHDIAQGGVALLKGTGWFSGPDFVGLEQIYDCTDYYPDLEHAVKWDFTKYIPHVVIVAIGQNDHNPRNFMVEDYNCKESVNWRRHYGEFLLRLRELYPKALIICTTTILGHDRPWDTAIDEVVKELGDSKITHFLYSRNGSGTPGHIRISEAEEMSEELSTYIQSFGEEIWGE